MRILYLSADPGVPVLGHKGASVHLRAMASAFASLDHDVMVASPRVAAGDNRLDSAIRLVEIPPILPRRCSSAAALREQMETQEREVVSLAHDGEFRVIYERHSLASFAGARASRELGLPLLLEVNAPLRAEAARFRVLVQEDEAHSAEQESFAAASRIFAVSRVLADWLVEEGVGAGKVEVVPNAFPLRRFPEKSPLGQETAVVGFAGGLKLWHGVDVLLDAFERALARGADMRLEVAGTGPAEPHLRSTGLPAARLRPLGHLPHDLLLERLKRWDVGVAPFTAVDNFYFSPLKLFEYMAAGLCPVASALGDIPELLDHGAAGVLVPPDDPDALADALVALDENRTHLRELGRRAREEARAGPTWMDNARRVLAGLEGQEAA